MQEQAAAATDSLPAPPQRASATGVACALGGLLLIGVAGATTATSFSELMPSVGSPASRNESTFAKLISSAMPTSMKPTGIS